MNSPDKSWVEYQRQIKIDADIDEVIKTIRALGTESDENGDPFTRLMFRRVSVFGSYRNCGVVRKQYERKKQ